MNYSNANKSIEMSNGEIAGGESLLLCLYFRRLALADHRSVSPTPARLHLSPSSLLHPYGNPPTPRPPHQTAYVAATVASCSIAVGLSTLVPRLRGLQPTTKALLAKFIPFASVASAGVVNIGLMRWKEIRDGESVREGGRRCEGKAVC